MANKPLKSITFPGLTDTYTVPQVDDTLAVQGAAADAKKVGDELTDIKGDINEKASVNGTYENMTAGNAEQLLSDEYAEDKVPYLFRQSGGGVDVGDRAEDTIVGGTIAWNQLFDYTAFSASKTNNGITFTNNEDGTITANGTATARAILPLQSIRIEPDHVFFFGTPETQTVEHWVGNSAWGLTKKYMNKLNTSGKIGFNCMVEDGASLNNYVFRPQLIDLTAMFGSTIADYIYALETATAGAGVAFFRKLFPKPYYPYDAGTLKHVEGLVSHDCVGFNQWDEVWEVGNITNSGGNDGSTDRIRSKNYIPVIPGLMYHAKIPSNTFIRVAFYDAQKAFISLSDLSTQPITFVIPDTCRHIRFNLGTDYGTTYKNDICINLSDPAKNGTYEPYTKHSYPLDSTLTLRGIPKLDASNNLYFDGDVYEADGTVTRRYDSVDLGTLEWTYAASIAGTPLFISSAPTGIKAISSGVPNIFTSGGYTVKSWGDLNTGANASNGITVFSNGGVRIVDASYTDATTFASAMSGVYMVYELATPTTENATPYQSIQLCDDFGTEEYVIDSDVAIPVPVGHDSKYPVNLKAKIEGLPWNFATLIAPTEASYTASRAYTTGQLFIVNNILYQATANIASGGTITPNTNCTATTLAEVISTL